jgi:hypothetical protein
MDMQTVVPETARIARVESFPAKGDDFLAIAKTALVARSSSSKADVDTWHRQLGHLNTDAVMRMVKNGMVKGMEINGKAALSTPCEPCLKGKQTRAEIHKTTDTCTMTITDDRSRKVFVAGLHQKSEVACHLKVFIACAELETGRRLKVLRSNGGGEYTGGELGKYLEEKGIQHEITTPDTPQHNGVAERMNRTLLDKVRAMLLNAGLPESTSRTCTMRLNTQPTSITSYPPEPLGISPQKKPGAGTSLMSPDFTSSAPGHLCISQTRTAANELQNL